MQRGPALSQVRRCLGAFVCITVDQIIKDIVCFLYLAFQDLGERFLNVSSRNLCCTKRNGTQKIVCSSNMPCHCLIIVSGY